MVQTLIEVNEIDLNILNASLSKIISYLQDLQTQYEKNGADNIICKYTYENCYLNMYIYRNETIAEKNKRLIREKKYRERRKVQLKNKREEQKLEFIKRAKKMGLELIEPNKDK